jgi:aspartyl-tRNA(Asn)/glutamyl-tRNA(Gln) amidotransferase subunit B
LRDKENESGYRYFPEPDLPPLVVTRELAQVYGKFEFLPNDLRRLLDKAGIGAREAEVLVGEPELAKLWFEAHQLQPKHARFVFTWLTGPEIKLRESQGGDSRLTARVLNQVAEMAAVGQLSTTNARELLALLRTDAADPAKLAQERGLMQESNEGELVKVVEQVIADNPKAVADYQAGNQRAFGALVGACMKATHGKGNPPLINKLLKARLG